MQRSSRIANPANRNKGLEQAGADARDSTEGQQWAGGPSRYGSTRSCGSRQRRAAVSRWNFWSIQGREAATTRRRPSCDRSNTGEGVGQSIVSSRGEGWLRAANPASSATPPMKIAGSCELPLVFRPEHIVRKVLVRVVQDLSYALIIGAAFLRRNRSVTSFAAGRGFKLAPESHVGTPYLVDGRDF